MAINLASKYSDKMATMFTKSSYVSGKTNQEYNFTGVKTLKVYTPTTVPLSDYTRGGVSRYGVPQEMQDTVQEMTMTQDRAFSLVIDKGNNTEQMLMKNSGKMMKLQIDEQVVPEADRYAIGRYVALAGTVAGVSSKPTKTTIVEHIADGTQAMDDHAVPDDGRYIFLTAEMYKLLRLAPEFLGLEQLGSKALGKGVVGEMDGAKVVKVPTKYLPPDCYFVMWHPKAVIQPYKINDAKVHKDPPGISGALLEGRNLYDAFVLGAMAYGVYACVLGTKKLDAPTISIAGGTATITEPTGATRTWYTVDGSDPRYSDSAEVYSVSISVAAGAKVRAYAVGTDKYPSDVAEEDA